MATQSRLETDRLNSKLSDRLDEQVKFTQTICAQPQQFDFYLALRLVENFSPDKPLIGTAKRPSTEFWRFGQSPELTFAPASFASAAQTASGKLKLKIRFFGLFGPHGALPLHLTELAYERDRNFGDATMCAFADIFHHRAISMFYQIWRQAQPAANRDRPAQDRFMDFVGALAGHAGPNWHELDQVPAVSKRFFAGHLGRLAKTPEGLEQILSTFFKVPVKVKTFAARWMDLPLSEQTYLGARGPLAALGQGATIGRRVFDAQSNIEIVFGPMNANSYKAMLPGGVALDRAKDWVNSYLNGEWFVRSRHVLKAEEVPALVLGQGAQLGWTSWLGKKTNTVPAADLTISNYY